MILLDTNVVSELMKTRPHAHVSAFFERVWLRDLYLPSVAVAEIRYGIERLPEGRWRDDIERGFAAFLAEGFGERIVVFDPGCAAGYARFRVARERVGRSVTVLDAMIGGMAMAFGARLATRNIADFDLCGLNLIDPWRADRSP